MSQGVLCTGKRTGKVPKLVVQGLSYGFYTYRPLIGAKKTF